MRTRRPATTRTAPRRTDARPDAGPRWDLRTRGDRAAHRRREQPAPDPLEAAAGRGRPRRAHLHGRHRQRGGDDARGRGLQGPQPARRADAAADRRDHRRRRTTPPTIPTSCAAIYDGIDTRLVIRAGADGGHVAVRRRRASWCCSSAASPRCSGSGGCHERGISCRRSVPASCWRCCRSSSASGSGRCGAGTPACATRACRSSARRCPRSSRIRRHLPFALFVLALGSLVVAMARPVDIVSVPAGQTTVILAMDVSRSMCATDIPPNRLIAAEEAAASFIERQGVEHPDRHRRLRRVRRDRPGADDRPGGPARCRREPDDRPPDGDRQRHPEVARRDRRDRRRASRQAWTMDDAGRCRPAPRSPTGAYAPAIIVLLTDGASNAGPEPVDAAQQAAARGVRVYTIGFGTGGPGRRELPMRAPVHRPRAARHAVASAVAAAGAAVGSGGRSTRTRSMPVADATGGTYYPAESADELRTVFAEPADQPDHEARGHGDQRRVRGARRGPGRRGDPPRVRPGVRSRSLARRSVRSIDYRK